MFRNLIVCGLLVLMVACGAAATKKMNNLERSIDRYVAALRWSRPDEARSFHLDRDRNKPEIDTSIMDTIRVTGYKVRKKVVNEDLSEATVISNLDYYSNEYGTLKTMTLEQEWWYDEEAERWFIESGFPVFE